MDAKTELAAALHEHSAAHRVRQAAHTVGHGTGAQANDPTDRRGRAQDAVARQGRAGRPVAHCDPEDARWIEAVGSEPRRYFGGQLFGIISSDIEGELRHQVKVAHLSLEDDERQTWKRSSTRRKTRWKRTAPESDETPMMPVWTLAMHALREAAVGDRDVLAHPRCLRPGRVHQACGDACRAHPGFEVRRGVRAPRRVGRRLLDHETREVHFPGDRLKGAGP